MRDMNNTVSVEPTPGKHVFDGAFLSVEKQHPLLDEEDENTLAEKISEERNEEAFEKLVLSNIRSALVCARDIKRRAETVDVVLLAMDAMTGLMTAAWTFKPNRGVRFPSHATPLIFRRICDASRNRRLPFAEPSDPTLFLADDSAPFNIGARALVDALENDLLLPDVSETSR